MDPVMTAITVTFVLCGVSMVYMLITEYKLMMYLQEHHYERWCYITTIGKWGAGFSNPLRGWDYLLSDRDDEDPNVRMLKQKVKLSILYCICMLVAISVVAISSILIAIVTEAARH